MFPLLVVIFASVFPLNACKAAAGGIKPKPLDAICHSPLACRVASLKDHSDNSNMMLFDFTMVTNLENWEESSDTVRVPGMSKASLVLQKTKQYQRAIFFALLNPQPDGACFAGVRSQTDFDSSKYNAIQIRLRGVQGDLWRYKLLLTNQKNTYQRSYESFFELKDSCRCKQTEGACHCELDVTLPMDSFEAYYRGKLDPDAPPLNSSNVVSVGLQAAGGVFEEEKQFGVGSIEIDWIKLIT